MGTHLMRPSSCKLVALPGRAGGLPKCRRRGCLGCRRLTRPSLTGSQSRLGMRSWLGSRQHSSTSASSGSLVGPSSRPVGRGPRGYLAQQPCPEGCPPRRHHGLLRAHRAPGARPSPALTSSVALGSSFPFSGLSPLLCKMGTHLFIYKKYAANTGCPSWHHGCDNDRAWPQKHTTC